MGKESPIEVGKGKEAKENLTKEENYIHGERTFCMWEQDGTRREEIVGLHEIVRKIKQVLYFNFRHIYIHYVPR